MRLVGPAGLSQLSRELNVASHCMTHGVRLLLPDLRVCCLPLSAGLKVSDEESIATGIEGFAVIKEQEFLHREA